MSQSVLSLCGTWQILKDPSGVGLAEGWQNALPHADYTTIETPGRMSSHSWGMHFSYANIFPEYHGYVWYYRQIKALPNMRASDRCLVEFDRAGYLCRVFFNGALLGEHRHHEERFSFDVTPHLNRDGDNLLVVQCFEPRAIGEEIEGITLDKIPNGIWADSKGVLPGVADEFCMECFGGITGEVRLLSVPKERIEDVYVRPHADNGSVDVTVTLFNAGDRPSCTSITLSIGEQTRGLSLLTVEKEVMLPVGRSEITLSGCVEHRTLWEPDNPFLYLATVSLDAGHAQTVRFGFKDLRIENGFFFLNGKRFLLKGAHAMPDVTSVVAMKALGFNAIRSIHRSFYKEVLDTCDEIGMLVLESSVTSWGMTLHENTEQMLYDYTANMVRMHRSHASIGGFYIFNELDNVNIMHLGAGLLPSLRALDPDHLFFLSSGRWDKDINTGSASNPLSAEWDVLLGAEGDATFEPRDIPRKFHGGKTDGAMGDIHPYMIIPIDTETRHWLRTLGEKTRPVFVSETGVGTQSNPLIDFLHYGKGKLFEVVTMDALRHVLELADEFLDFYDLRSLYPTISELCHEADRKNGAQRAEIFDIIRSNPKISGYSLTSVGTGNEGIFEGHGVIKESVAHAIQEGWEPLRWALFSSDRTVYADHPFELEAVLCNEDVLPPGQYAAKLFIRGAYGTVWHKEITVDYPTDGYGGMPPLSATVWKDSLCLPSGDYTFSARLMEGGVAFGGDLPITVAPAPKEIPCSVLGLGLSEKTREVLSRLGASTDSRDATLMLVGNPTDPEAIELIAEYARRGGNILFLDHTFFDGKEALLAKIAGERATWTPSHGRLYHHDHVAPYSPVFEGMHTAGMLTIEAFGALFPIKILSNGRKPEKTLCAAVRIESTLCGCGVSLAEYAWGNGRCILNSFRIEESLGAHPFAELLLANLIKAYA